VGELLNATGYSLQGNRKTRRVTATPTGMRNSPISTPNEWFCRSKRRIAQERRTTVGGAISLSAW
jgi:hypothetical protein